MTHPFARAACEPGVRRPLSDVVRAPGVRRPLSDVARGRGVRRQLSGARCQCSSTETSLLTPIRSIVTP
jgi:hypothetical protein